MEKYILDLCRDPDQSRNVTGWTEGLSFHRVWFKSVNNLLIYPSKRQTTNRHTEGIKALPRNFVGGANKPRHF